MDLSLKSLSGRTYIAAFGPIIAALVTFAMFGAAVIYYHSMDALTTQGEMVGQSIATGGQYYVLTGNMYEVKKLACLGIQIAPTVDRIEILSPSHEIMTMCERENTKWPTDVQTLVVPILYATADAVSTASQPKAEVDPSSVLAFARVTINREHTVVSLKRTGSYLLAGLILVLAGALTVSFRLVKKLVAALSEVGYVIRKIAAGNYEPQFRTAGVGETTELQSLLLSMAKEVGESKLELEKQVEKRTEELLNEARANYEAINEKRRLIVRMTTSLETERRGIAMDVHDTINSTVISLLGDMRAAKSNAFKFENDAGGPGLIKLISTAEENANYVYEYCKSLINNLRPEALDNFGLAEALPHLVETFNMKGSKCSYRIWVENAFPDFGYDFNIIIYRIVQEALSNVEKHAEASTCSVGLRCQRKGDEYVIDLHIQDNGQGFDVASQRNQSGLLSMRERIEGLNGSLKIQSEAGEGSSLKFHLIHKFILTSEQLT